MELPREVLTEPLELGTPDADVAQGASRAFTRQELECLEEIMPRRKEYGTSGNSFVMRAQGCCS
jgi:hypothetical protein